MNNESLPSYTYEQANIINAFRFYAIKLAYLLRFYIIESITGLGDRQFTANEIKKIPLEESNLPNLAADLSPLSLAYVTELISLIDGMLSGDEAKSDESVRRLYELSDENARTLAQLSPYWDEEEWRNLFYRFNRDLIAEVISIKSGDYSEALNIFETLMRVSLEEGDYYAQGFIHSLPEDQPKIPIAYFNMIKDLRSLGMERAYLTRFYIVAKILELYDENIVTETFFRLISRTKEKFELIFGTEIAEELVRFLSLYVIKVEGVIDAILSGDSATMETKSREVDEFINSFASFFARINPYWDEAKWKELFSLTAALIIEQSADFHNKEYKKALHNFQNFMFSTFMIDDYFAYGLYQFTQSQNALSV